MTPMGSPLYAFLLILNGNIGPNSAALQGILLQSFKIWMHFTLTYQRSLKLKCDGVIGLSLYGFLLIYIETACLSPFSCYSYSKCFLLSIIIRPKLRKIQSAPNDLKMTLNATRTKVYNICRTTTRESQMPPRFALRWLVFQIIDVFTSPYPTIVSLNFKRKSLKIWNWKFQKSQT